MGTLILSGVLAALIVAVAVAGAAVKLYTKRYLKDIDGYRGIHKKKELAKK